MNLTFVGGLTGFASLIFSGLRKPIELPFEMLRGHAGIELVQRHYRKHGDITQHLIATKGRYRKIVILGHSYGASGATWIFPELLRHGIEVDLFISEDQGLDSLFIKDKAITRNVREVDQYHVVYERLGFASDFSGKHNYYDVSRWPGGHTDTFTRDAVVRRIVDRILEVHHSA